MLHLFESITEDTVTVLVRFPPFSRQKDFTEHKHLPVVFSFQETTVKLKAFSEHLASYLGFLRKILPYQLKRYLSFDRSVLKVLCQACSTVSTCNSNIKSNLKTLWPLLCLKRLNSSFFLMLFSKPLD